MAIFFAIGRTSAKYSSGISTSFSPWSISLTLSQYLDVTNWISHVLGWLKHDLWTMAQYQGRSSYDRKFGSPVKAERILGSHERMLRFDQLVAGNLSYKWIASTYIQEETAMFRAIPLMILQKIQVARLLSATIRFPLGYNTSLLTWRSSL